MTKEEHTQAIQDIRKLVNDDDGKITELLTNLSDDYGKILAENSDYKLKNEKLTNDNDKLRDTNMRLFLKVGTTEKEEEEPEEKEEEKLTFENLFDEKGDLISGGPTTSAHASWPVHGLNVPLWAKKAQRGVCNQQWCVPQRCVGLKPLPPGMGRFQSCSSFHQATAGILNLQDLMPHDLR